MATKNKTASVAPVDLTFSSEGVNCAAWHFPAASDVLADAAGRPAVVLAHGFGGTRDSGLASFGAAFAAAGIDAIALDYRNFGASGGEPRQLIDIKAQLADYAAALRLARDLDGVDPDRVAIWGYSFSGGHVFRVAATDGRVAAAIALAPLTDGRAVVRQALKRTGVAALVRGIPASLVATMGGSPAYLPLAGQPGEPAALNAPGAYESYLAVAGPTWENRYTMPNPLAFASYRPGADAPKVPCPVLVQLGELDRSADPLIAADDARGLRAAEIRHYPCDHFDVLPGSEWHERVVSHQVRFLTRHLASETAA